MTTCNPDRNTLRRDMRHQRRALSPGERHDAALRAAESLYHTPVFLRSQHIALYLSNDGELDLEPLFYAALENGKQCYLPVLHPARSNRLWFLPYDTRTVLRNNRFGIPEPRARGPRHARAPWAMDLILTPLVAFDAQGHRLGMGGGYYDRTLAYLHHRAHWRKPQLVGTAYDFQKVSTLPAEPWDVPLDGILTPQGFHPFT